MTNFDPTKYLMFEGVAGSRLYGTATQESDFDSRGVCVPPMRLLLDPFQGFEVKDSGFELGDDRAIFSLAKFFELSAKGNPNIVELLYVPADQTLYADARWHRLLEERELFITNNVRKAFAGYSFHQNRLIERHRKWYMNPMTVKPTREMYGLSQTPLISEANIQNFMSIPQDLFGSDIQDELRREREYREAKKQWDGFNQWQQNRNPKRKSMEEKVGYDTKAGMHLLRLLLEGRELLETGYLEFPLTYRNLLFEVRSGELSYEEFLDVARVAVERLDSVQSILPDKPNYNKIKDLYFELLEM
jgi:predicted nucleotidyltransferase